MEASKIKTYVFETKDQWKEFRGKKLFTSSRIIELLADAKRDMTEDEKVEWKKSNPKSTAKQIVDPSLLSDGAISYIMDVAINDLAIPKPDYYDAAMEWGLEQEPQAVLRLAEHLGMDINDKDFIYTSVGGFVFFVYDNKIGGTPDVIIPTHIVEIKCPNSDTHLYYRSYLTKENFAKELPRYYASMQNNMQLAQRNKGYFVSFDPRFKDYKKQFFILEIEADKEFQSKILNKVEPAYKELIRVIEA